MVNSRLQVDVTEETILGEAKAPAHHLIDSLPPSHGDTRGVVVSTPSAPATPGSALNQSTRLLSVFHTFLGG